VVIAVVIAVVIVRAWSRLIAPARTASRVGSNTPASARAPGPVAAPANRARASLARADACPGVTAIIDRTHRPGALTGAGPGREGQAAADAFGDHRELGAGQPPGQGLDLDHRGGEVGVQELAGVHAGQGVQAGA